MALNRRTGQRFQASIWPGFVDAMTALLLVLMFVLTIFMVIQFVLKETITGQENELDQLSSEVLDLARALGLEQQRSDALETEIGDLTGTLQDERNTIDTQLAMIAALTTQNNQQADALDAQTAAITNFEAQVAQLLLQRDAALDEGSALAQALSERDNAFQEAANERDTLQLALAQTRDEVDQQIESARLAAAKTEAMQALIDELNQTNTDQSVVLTDIQDQLSEEEKARIAEAAAAQALREKLAGAEDELSAMTLALEAQRQEAEDTLTLLAAAQAAKRNADLTAAETLTNSEERQRLLALANEALSQEEAKSAESLRKLALLNEQVASLRTQLGTLQSILDAAADADADAQVQIDALGSQLNTALARAASEERKRRQLEEAERIRLEAEAEALRAQTRDLESYRSEFFGRLRDILSRREGVQIAGDRFVFSSEVLFQQGSADLSFEGRQQIASIAAILQSVSGEIPDEIDWIIRVDGHTDNTPLSGSGLYADNWELSQARALSVVRYMTNALGLPPNRLAANGFGEYQPINPSDTAEARAQNRRIELKLTEK
ncbi:MAG: peptidoglycan -binding protein [Pseudoruegeria sp.]